jgi:hypothetical protein
MKAKITKGIVIRILEGFENEMCQANYSLAYCKFLQEKLDGITIKHKSFWTTATTNKNLFYV